MCLNRSAHFLHLCPDRSAHFLKVCKQECTLFSEELTSNTAPHDLRPPSKLVFIVEKALGITSSLNDKPGQKVGANRAERSLKLTLPKKVFTPIQTLSEKCSLLSRHLQKSVHSYLDIYKKVFTPIRTPVEKCSLLFRHF